MKFCVCGRSAKYTTIADYVHVLGNAPWEEKEQVRSSHFGVDLLVLDEVQVRDSGKQWQDNELTTLVDRRYRDGKSTVLVSNLKDEALKQNLGDSIWRRIIETGGDPIETDWPRIEQIKQEKEAADALRK